MTGVGPVLLVVEMVPGAGGEGTGTVLIGLWQRRFQFFWAFWYHRPHGRGETAVGVSVTCDVDVGGVIYTS